MDTIILFTGVIFSVHFGAKWLKHEMLNPVFVLL